MNSRQKVVFNDLSINTVFKCLKNEVVGHGPISRIVRNDSTYIKVGHNHSVDLRSGKDCVFDLKLDARIVDTKMQIDMHNMDAYKVNVRGAAL